MNKFSRGFTSAWSATEVKEKKPADRHVVTLNDVAQEAGVSRATVSLVLRESPLVAAKTRNRVTDAMASVGYVYNRGAAGLRTGMSGTIGLIVPEITNPFYAELTTGIDDMLDLEGKLTFLANSRERPERQERFLRRIREQGVDGIILSAAEGSTAALADQLREWRLPFIQILRAIDDTISDFVAPDFRLGTQLAVDHLVGQGHRRIALMPSTRNTSAARERIDAFGTVLQAQGLAPASIVPCTVDRAAVAEAVDRLLQGSEPPTAVVCHNDLMALGVMRALRTRGLAPGRDLSVIGFDDIPEATNAVPQLTTVATAPATVGREAARLLLRRIASPTGAPERILIEPRLMVRDT